MLKCLICGSIQVDTCHIKSRGAGGKDDQNNLFYACREHHQEQHRIGIVSFALKYPQAKRFFFVRGWDVVDELGQKKLRRR